MLNCSLCRFLLSQAKVTRSKLFNIIVSLVGYEMHHDVYNYGGASFMYHTCFFLILATVFPLMNVNEEFSALNAYNNVYLV